MATSVSGPANTSSMSQAAPETPRTRSKRMLGEADDYLADIRENAGERNLLCDDLVRFGKLPCVRRRMSDICESQGLLNPFLLSL